MRKSDRHRPSRRAFGMLATALAVAPMTACATDEEAALGGDGPAVSLDDDLHAAAVEKAKEIAGGEQLGGSLEVINENGGREGAIIQAALAPFTEATGVQIRFTGTSDYNNIISSRIKAGNPPDIGSQTAGSIQSYIADGVDVLNLSEVLGEDALASNFREATLATTTVEGGVRGIYQGFSNYMVWYNPSVFDGPMDGEWDDMAAWTANAAAAGATTPWCIAQENGPATGAIGAQWIEALFAKANGLEKARAWGEGSLPWTSPEVRAAFEAFGAIAKNEDAVNGGVSGSLSQSTSTGPSVVVAEPPQCQAVIGGTWTAALIDASSSGVRPGENLDFFPVPPADMAYEHVEAFNAQAMYAFTDTPSTRAFMAYVASAEEQRLLASGNNWTVSNINVETDLYASELLQKAAETFFAPDVEFALGPGALADAGVKSTWWQGIVSYLSGETSLDAVLARIQAAHSESIR